MARAHGKSHTRGNEPTASAARPLNRLGGSSCCPRSWEDTGRSGRHGERQAVLPAGAQRFGRVGSHATTRTIYIHAYTPPSVPDVAVKDCPPATRSSCRLSKRVRTLTKRAALERGGEPSNYESENDFAAGIRVWA